MKLRVTAVVLLLLVTAIAVLGVAYLTKDHRPNGIVQSHVISERSETPTLKKVCREKDKTTGECLKTVYVDSAGTEPFRYYLIIKEVGTDRELKVEVTYSEYNKYLDGDKYP